MPAAKGTVPWNAGASEGWTDKRGYRWKYVSENGRRVARREHRVIVEQSLGRKLEPGNSFIIETVTPTTTLLTI